MSDWGEVYFYYNYEYEDKYGRTRNSKGIIVKNYKSYGILGMLSHAYYGIRYFLKNRYNAFMDFNMDDIYGSEDMSDWATLGTAFNVFFDFNQIVPGFDSAKYVLTHHEEYLDDNNLEKLKNDLFNCEGTDGFFFISYTGNPNDGYKLKYAYNYDEKLLDIQDTLDVLTKSLREKAREEYNEFFADILRFFEDNNATLISSYDEFWGLETDGVEIIKAAMNEWKKAENCE